MIIALFGIQRRVKYIFEKNYCRYINIRMCRAPSIIFGSINYVLVFFVFPYGHKMFYTFLDITVRRTRELRSGNFSEKSVSCVREQFRSINRRQTRTLGWFTSANRDFLSPCCITVVWRNANAFKKVKSGALEYTIRIVVDFVDRRRTTQQEG